MKNELAVVLDEYKSVEITKAQSIASQFAPQMAKVNELSPVLSTLNRENPTALDSQKAREARLILVKNRSSAQDVKDKLKRGLLDEGKLIDGLFNVVANSSKLIEADLEKVEKHVELQEKIRKEELRVKRSEELAKLEVDSTFYQLGEMSEESYQQLLSSSKISYDLKVAERKRIEDERIAQEKAEAERRQKIEEENKILKAKLEEQAKIDAEKKVREEAERQRVLAEQKAKDDEIAKLKREADSKAEAERKRIADERAKVEAERLKKALQDQEALLAPDKEKVKTYFASIKAIEKPMLKDATLSKKLDLFMKAVDSLITNF